jgi:predicted ArsR family transcriptional regulator
MGSRGRSHEAVLQLMAKQIKVNAMSYAKLIAEFQVGGHSVTELAEATGLAYTTVREHVVALHREKLIHISSYSRDAMGRENARVWAWGENEDAKRKPLSHNKRMARHRTKKKHAELLGILGSTT